jgi:hypothetical protein
MGKKIIRLTESDLVRLVKRVIQEEEGNKVNYHAKIKDCLKTSTSSLVTWTSEVSDKYDLYMHGDLKLNKEKYTVSVDKIQVTSQKTNDTNLLVYSVVYLARTTSGGERVVKFFNKVEFKINDITKKDGSINCEKVKVKIFDYLNTIKK